MIYIFRLPDSSAPPANFTEAASGQQWWERFTELRRNEAEKLFELAQSAIKAKQPALAFELVRETVRENPDHEGARRILDQRRRATRSQH